MHNELRRRWLKNMISSALAQKIDRKNDRLLLIGYSKGIVDILNY